ncbi:MAG: phosphoribosylamine--glycine ligase [Clostridiales bacterium]|nr:phosphoribosylamine--glycine ligase [Clostridiales bacterium]
MKILVIGSGGREHAVVKAIVKSPLCEKVYALPGNPGMKECTRIPGNPLDIDRTVQTAKEYQIDFCVVTPEDPLAAGLVDALNHAGIPCFGPSQKATRIESSKVFSKNLMKKYGIPTADFKVFDELAPALAYAKAQPYPLVIKADGLARGKGVVIAQDYAEAEHALFGMLSGQDFGESGKQVIIEETLVGPEVSLLCLADGQTILPLVSAMDHKRAKDGDVGLNTGGMGAIAPSPLYTQELAALTQQRILEPTMAAMQAEGCPFAGCLFVGLMLTEDGPRVLEYNARMGDPETQAVLPLMTSDLLDHLIACSKGTLHLTQPLFLDEAACCLVLTSKGYPERFQTGYPISAQKTDAQVCFAGVKEVDGHLVTAGGRVMSVTAVKPRLQDAIKAAYAAAERIDFKDKSYRTDIGQKALRGI